MTARKAKGSSQSWRRLGAVVFAAAVAACTHAPARAEAAERPGFVPKLCPAAMAKANAVCGTFSVLENRARPHGRTLPLRVVIIRATHPAGQPPIFVLGGGPGQAATSFAPGYVESWERKDHDVVFMDVRGTGEGDRLDCPLPAGAPLEAFVQDAFADGVDYGACRRTLERSADLDHYTTPEAMRDVDELRAALGYRKIDIEGGSYGSRAGLTYAHMFSPHLQAMVLSGLAALDNRLPLYHAAAGQRAFDRIVAQCAAEPACHAAFPDPAADLTAVLERLRAAPPTVEVKDPRTGAKGEMRLDEAGFANGLRVLMYGVEDGRRLPRLLHEARLGDYGPFGQAALAGGYGLRTGLAYGLLLSVSCPEDTDRIRPDEVAPATRGTFLADRRVVAQMKACAGWSRPKIPAWYYQPFRSKVPTLLVSGDLDPVTPPQWRFAFERAFPDHVSVVAKGAHVSDNDCISAMSKALLDHGRTKDVDTRCLAEEKLPPFDVGKGAAAKP